MRFKRLLITSLSAIVLLTGCIKEDTGDCPNPQDVVISFRCITPASVEFTDVISSVDLMIFDSRGYYTEGHTRDAAALAQSQQIAFSLDKGLYYVLAWANAGSNSVFNSFTPGVTSLSECYVRISDTSTRTGDPLYYAPAKNKPASRSGLNPGTDYTIYELDVAEGQKTVKVLDFVRAHRTINVWVKGFNDVLSGVNLQPTLRASNLWAGYDSHFTTLAARLDLVQQATQRVEGGATYSLATFHSAMGIIDGDQDITLVRTSSGGDHHTVNLKKFVEDNSLTDTDEIDILMEFMGDLSVKVTIPDWKVESVTPGTN